MRFVQRFLQPKNASPRGTVKKKKKTELAYSTNNFFVIVLIQHGNSIHALSSYCKVMFNTHLHSCICML